MRPEIGPQKVCRYGMVGVCSTGRAVRPDTGREGAGYVPAPVVITLPISRGASGPVVVGLSRHHPGQFPRRFSRFRREARLSR